MSASPRILLLMTSCPAMESGRLTGVWFEELSTPYYAFLEAGAQVTLASLKGGAVPIDPHSLAEDDKPASVLRFQADAVAMAKLADSLALESLDLAGYDAIFLPGGHGTMFDLPVSQPLADFLTRAWAEGRVLSAVCHGPAGLVNVRDVDGKPLVAGRRFSAFSNSEEQAAGLTDAVPFLLETRLCELGGVYERAPDFTQQAVRDGRLVTGQNPQSSDAVARLVLAALRDSH